MPESWIWENKSLPSFYCTKNSIPHSRLKAQSARYLFSQSSLLYVLEMFKTVLSESAEPFWAHSVYGTHMHTVIPVRAQTQKGTRVPEQEEAEMQNVASKRNPLISKSLSLCWMKTEIYHENSPTISSRFGGIERRIKTFQFDFPSQHQMDHPVTSVFCVI